MIVNEEVDPMKLLLGVIIRWSFVIVAAVVTIATGVVAVALAIARIVWECVDRCQFRIRPEDLASSCH